MRLAVECKKAENVDLRCFSVFPQEVARLVLLGLVVADISESRLLLR